MNPLSGRRRSRRRRFSGSPNKVVVYLKAAARSDGYACPAPSHRLIGVPVRTLGFPNEHELWPARSASTFTRDISCKTKKRSPPWKLERSITFNLSSARETPRYSFQFCRLGPLGSSGPSRRRIPAFPRNLPPEECRIAPKNGTARMGEIPCMLCLSSHTDGRTRTRTGGCRSIGVR